MSYSDFDEHPSRNKGFSVGFVGGLIMIFVSLLVFFMNGARTNGDILVWVLQLLVYFFVGRTAAIQQAEAQENTYEPTKGIVGAGVGAPLIVAIMMWVFIIIRAFVRDAAGNFVFIEPLSFCGWIIIDVLLAIAIGRAAGSTIEKQYDLDHYDMDRF